MVASYDRNFNGRIDQTANTEPTIEAILEGLNLLCQPGDVHELRSVKTSQGTIGGFFADREAMAEQAYFLTLGCTVETRYGMKQVAPVPAVYFSINPVDHDMLAVIGNRIKCVGDEAAKDKDVVRRTSILIDVDSIRRAGISASDDEHEYALEVTRKIRDYLSSLGYPEPCYADSGNGGHLIYAINLPNDAESKTLVEKFLAVIAKQFSDSRAEVDQTVCNAGRICTIYGTYKRKGDSTQARPHRLSKIIDSPTTLTPISRRQLELVIGHDDKEESEPDAETVAGESDVRKVINDRKKAVGMTDDDTDEVGEKWFQKYSGNLRTLDIVGLFESRDLNPIDKGAKVMVTCPWGETDHTDGDDGGAVVFRNEGKFPTFSCSHQTCKIKNRRNLEQVCDWFGEDAINKHCTEHFKPKSKPRLKAQTDGDDDEDGKKAKPKSIAAVLLEMFDSSESVLLRDTDSTPYVRVKQGDHWQTMPLKSESFTTWMTGIWYEATHSPLKSDHIKDVVGVLTYRASKEGRQKIYLRWAQVQDKIYLDLGTDQWEVIEVSRDGWRITDDCPVVFRRNTNTAAFPMPLKNGNLDDLRPFFTGDDNSYLLFKGSLLAAVTEGSYFATFIHGEPGSGKSWVCRFARRLIDPAGKVELSMLPKIVNDDFVKGIHHQRVCCYDNVSFLSKETSDFLCTLSTGGGFNDRSLYTNDDMKYYDYMRPAWINGIPDFNEASDLADRAITLHMPTLEHREDENDLNARWTNALPSILGGFLDVLSQGCRRLETTKNSGNFRMARAARWVDACIGDNSFSKAYTVNRSGSAENSLKASPIADLICKFFKTKKPTGCEGSWKGTSSDLHKAVQKLARELGYDLPDKFPKQANGFSGQLRRDAPNLRTHRGIQIAWPPLSRGYQLITIEKYDPEKDSPENDPVPTNEEPPVTQEDPVVVTQEMVQPQEQPIVVNRIRYGIDDVIEVKKAPGASLRIVGEDAHTYEVAPVDPLWQPPMYFTANMNYGKPRYFVHKHDVVRKLA